MFVYNFCASLCRLDQGRNNQRSPNTWSFRSWFCLGFHTAIFDCPYKFRMILPEKGDYYCGFHIPSTRVASTLSSSRSPFRSHDPPCFLKCERGSSEWYPSTYTEAVTIHDLLLTRNSHKMTLCQDHKAGNLRILRGNSLGM